MPQRTSHKVNVYVRTRPTNNFASEILAIGRDNRVSIFFILFKKKLYFFNLIFDRQLAFIEHHQQVLLIIKSMIGHFILMGYLIMLIKKKFLILLVKMLSIVH
jgi:hypothetical protein